MFSVSRRALAEVHRYIQHGTLDDSDQLTLGIGRLLEMQASYHPVAGIAFIVLYECRLAYLFLKFLGREALEEVSAGILEYAGLYDNDPFDICLDYFHISRCLLFR
jgi:hypothetical protein